MHKKTCETMILQGLAKIPKNSKMIFCKNLEIMMVLEAQDSYGNIIHPLEVDPTWSWVDYINIFKFRLNANSICTPLQANGNVGKALHH